MQWREGGGEHKKGGPVVQTQLLKYIISFVLSSSIIKSKDLISEIYTTTIEKGRQTISRSIVFHSFKQCLPLLIFSHISYTWFSDCIIYPLLSLSNIITAIVDTLKYNTDSLRKPAHSCSGFTVSESNLGHLREHKFKLGELNRCFKDDILFWLVFI